MPRKPAKPKVGLQQPKATAKQSHGGVTFYENKKVAVARTRMGLYSFDVASEGGVVNRSMIELFGQTQSGKTSLAGYIAAVYSTEHDGDIAWCQTETIAREYMATMFRYAGYDGGVYMAEESKEVKGEQVAATSVDMIDSWIARFKTSTITAGVIDSIGGIAPPGILEGSVGDSHMGRQALVVKNTLMALIAWQRNKAKSNIVVMTNHMHSNIGGPGYTTSGGQAMQYYPDTKVRMWPEKKNEDGSLVVRGRFEKLKNKVPAHGHREFLFVIVPGKTGVHPGLTAVVDLESYGLLTLGTSVNYNGRKYPSFPKMVERAEEDDLFTPFIEGIYGKDPGGLNT